MDGLYDDGRRHERVKMASYWLAAMLIRAIDIDVKKYDSNLNFVVII